MRIRPIIVHFQEVAAVTMMVRPLGESAVSYVESVAFRGEGSLRERLQQLMAQGEDGRLLEPVEDEVEDDMELDEEGPDPRQDVRQPRAQALQRRQQQQQGQQQRQGLQHHQQGPGQQVVWLGSNGVLSVGTRPRMEAGSPALRRPRSCNLVQGLPQGLEILPAARAQGQRADHDHADGGAPQDGHAGADHVQGDPAQADRAQADIAQADIAGADLAQADLARADPALAGPAPADPDQVDRGDLPPPLAAPGEEHLHEQLEDDQRQVEDGVRARSPIVMGIDDLNVYIQPRPLQQQQPPHQVQEQQGHQMRGVADQDPQPRGRGRARARGRGLRSQDQQQPQLPQGRGRGRGSARSRPRSRSSSLSRTQRRLEAVAGQQRQLAQELRETKDQINLLSVQRHILQQERERGVRQLVLGRGQPLSVQPRPDQGGPRQLLQDLPPSRDPRVMAARARQERVADQGMGARAQRLQRRQQAKEAQAAITAALRRSLSEFMAGQRMGSSSTPGMMARSQAVALRNLARAATQVADHPRLRRSFR